MNTVLVPERCAQHIPFFVALSAVLMVVAFAGAVISWRAAGVDAEIGVGGCERRWPANLHRLDRCRFGRDLRLDHCKSRGGSLMIAHASNVPVSFSIVDEWLFGVLACRSARSFRGVRRPLDMDLRSVAALALYLVGISFYLGTQRIWATAGFGRGVAPPDKPPRSGPDGWCWRLPFLAAALARRTPVRRTHDRA